jgi:hypothetical protein
LVVVFEYVPPRQPAGRPVRADLGRHALREQHAVGLGERGVLLDRRELSR